jgi:hypothetical protein
VIVWVQRRAIPEPNTGCWLWTGRTDTAGYGRTTGGVTAHRHVWRLYGHAVEGFDQVIHHTCGVRACVNPAHLEAKDRAVHMQEHSAAKRKPIEHHRARQRAYMRDYLPGYRARRRAAKERALLRERVLSGMAGLPENAGPLAWASRRLRAAARSAREGNA